MNMKQKHLAVALSAIFATVALTGCGSDNDNNYAGTTPPVENPETPEVPEVPEVPGDNESDNPGNAAEGTSDLRTQTTVGGQQYVRQAGSEFDRANNNVGANNANSTVLNTVTLQNTKLENIVLGREIVKVYDAEGKVVLDAAGKEVTKTVIRYAGNGKSAGGVSGGSTGANLHKTLQVHNNNTTINANPSTTAQIDNSGLVIFDVAAQTAEAGATPPTTYVAAGSEEKSKSKVRIFGQNAKNDTNTVVNSYKFTGVVKTDAAGKANPAGDLSISGLTDTTAFKTTNLKNVQYGRVTSNIDMLTETQIKAGKNAEYYDSEIVAKGTADSVDTYFYRGTNETSIKDMATLKEAGGTFQYAGHALMYGIDNSYHGAKNDPNSNSVGGGAAVAVEGKGNFVEATVNMTDRNIKGNVFNVWEVKPTDSTSTFRKDNVVDFKGDVFGNTFKGDANLSYDTSKKGTVKGSFYGDKAQEIGGAFNSVTSGYGQSQWGGVFGAERDVVADSENNTENK